ncbi:MAG: hypothetical protein RR582_04440, partial [Niameybacter sp.]
EKALMEKELNVLREILDTEVMEVEAGQKQLLYAIHIAVSREMIEEERVLPVFFNLFTLNEMNSTVNYLNFAREQLKAIIFANEVLYGIS